MKFGNRQNECSGYTWEHSKWNAAWGGLWGMLIWILVKLMCSVCENSLRCTLLLQAWAFQQKVKQAKWSWSIRCTPVSGVSYCSLVEGRESRIQDLDPELRPCSIPRLSVLISRRQENSDPKEKEITQIWYAVASRASDFTLATYKEVADAICL